METRDQDLVLLIKQPTINQSKGAPQDQNDSDLDMTVIELYGNLNGNEF